MKKLVCLTILSFILLGSLSAEHKELKAFPKADKDMERFVIELPHRERGEEDSYKVEIIPGKTMMTDGVNNMRVGLSVESKPLKGWGYTFYEITGKAIAMSTLIAPPPGTKKVKKFVQGKSLIIPYNSRLPVVIYAPKGTEIRWRIWEAPAEFDKVDKG